MVQNRIHRKRGLYLCLISLVGLISVVLLLATQPSKASDSLEHDSMTQLDNAVCSVLGTHSDIQSALDDTLCEVLNILSGIFTGTFTTKHSISIHGQGATITAIDGNNNTPVFKILAGHQVTITDLAIRNGRDPDPGNPDTGGGIYNAGNLTLTNCSLENNLAMGGGIFNDGGYIRITNSRFIGNSGAGVWSVGNGRVFVQNSLFSDNSYTAVNNEGELVVLDTSEITGTTGSGIRNDENSHFVIRHTTVRNNEIGSGGGIYNNGVMTITNSVIDRNSSQSAGGGILQFNINARVTISNSTLSRNHAEREGGGIAGFGTVEVYNSTIHNNTAVNDGGGFYMLSGYKNIVNSTISNNSTDGNGGGIYVGGDWDILNSTIYSNSATLGGGLFIDGGVTVDNSIIGMSSGGDCYVNSGIINIDSYNLDTDDSCVAATKVDYLGIAPLANNGGSTSTHKLLPNSPAIDSGDDNPCPPNDQRGEVRPYDGDDDGLATCDVGSFELQVSDLGPDYPVFLPMINK